MSSVRACALERLFLLAAVAAAAAGCAWKAPDGWHEIEAWQVCVTAPGTSEAAAPPPDDAPWTTPEQLGRRELAAAGDFWGRVVDLPGSSRDDRLIVVRAYTPELAVYLGDTPIYRWPAAESATPSERLSYHLIRLPAGDLPLYARIPATTALHQVFGPWVLTREPQLPGVLLAYVTHPLVEDLDDLAIGWLTLLAGIAAAIVALARRDRLVAFFAAFSFLYGLRLLVGSHPTFLLGATPEPAFGLAAAITYLINLPAAALWIELLDRNWRFRRPMLALLAGFAIVAMLTDRLTGRPFAAGAANNVLVLTAFGLLAVLLLLQRRPAALERGEFRLLLAGTGIFLLLAANENLVGLGWLPWSWTHEPLGFVVFLAALGLVAGRRLARKERRLLALDAELATARRIQRSILPPASPQPHGLVVAARCEPASAVGGDLYDFAEEPDGGLGVLIADVAGHGVPAALIASMVKMSYSSLHQHLRAPADLLQEMNRMLCVELRREFVTAACLWVEPGGRRIRFARGGHPAALLRGPGGDIRELAPQGPLLGRFADARFGQEEAPLPPGSRLLLYTDGITEARRSGEPLGEGRLRARLAQSTGLDAEPFAGGLLTAAREWAAPGGPQDDLTVVVVDSGE